MAQLDGVSVKGLLCDITGVIIESRLVLKAQLCSSTRLFNQG